VGDVGDVWIGGGGGGGRRERRKGGWVVVGDGGGGPSRNCGYFRGVWMWLKDDGEKACCRLGFPSSHQSLTLPPISHPTLHSTTPSPSPPSKTLPQSTPQATAQTPKKNHQQKEKERRCGWGFGRYEDLMYAAGKEGDWDRMELEYYSPL